MSDLRPTNPIYLIWAGAYYVLRSRVFWVLVVVALIFWFWRDREESIDVAAQEQFYEQAIEAELHELIAESSAQRRLLSATSKSNDDQAQEAAFFFTPMLCEAIATRSYRKLGRMPTNWNDIVSSGVTRKIPPPRKGHRYVYNPKTGTIEEVPESENAN